MIPSTELIPGIYNYCDSWCERCRFTQRCQSFKLQYPDGIPQQDMSAETLVKRLMEALQMTKAYIEKKQAQLPQHTQLALEKRASGLHAGHLEEQTPVANLCDAYLSLTANWLKQEKDLLNQAAQQQAFEVDLGIRSEVESLKILNTLKDAWEIIKWYRTLIPVKVMSSLQMQRAPANDEVMALYFNGKAKLVLVSIDRSLQAWHTLLEQYPETTDEVLDMMVLLDRIRRKMDVLFPEARTFVRPGLDGPGLDGSGLDGPGLD